MKRKFSALQANTVREINSLNIPEAIELVAQLFSPRDRSDPPLILRSGAFLHQLYDRIGNATQVDQELHELRKQNLVKIITCKRIHTDISFVVLTSAYHAGLSSHQPHETATQIFLALISTPKYCSSSSFLISEILTYEDESLPGKLTREHIDRLIELDYVAMDASNDDVIWLNYPSILLMARQLVDGNQEIIRMITRKKYKEVYERELIKHDIKTGKSIFRASRLPILYHLYDLVGKGLIVRTERAGENCVNNLYRLPG